MSVTELRSAPQLKTGIAEVNGTRLFYEMKGCGFPLVFVSGGGVMDRRCWDEEFEVDHLVLAASGVSAMLKRKRTCRD